MSGRQQKKQKKKNEFTEPYPLDRAIWWVALAGLVLTTLIVRAHTVDFIAPQLGSPLLDTGSRIDVYGYSKYVLLMITSALLITAMLIKILLYRFQVLRSYINVPLFLLILFLVGSLCAAPYKSLALFGIWERYEGTLTLLAYFTLFFVLANTFFHRSFSKYLNLILGIILAVNLVIVMGDFYGYDFVQRSSLIKALVFPQTEMFNTTQGRLMSTLENPNYCGGITGALTAYFIALTLLISDNKRRIMAAILALASFLICLGSLSSGGFIGLLATAPLLIALPFIGGRPRQSLIGALILLLLFIPGFLILNKHNAGVYEETFGTLSSIISSLAVSAATPEASAASPVINPPVSPNTAQGINANPPLSSSLASSKSIIITPPAAGISFGGGRGYIWSKTIELIMQRPLLGYGRDTLAYYFPQEDINKVAGIATYNVIIQKPHSFYLDIAFGLGIPALITLLALFALHIFHTSRQLLQKKFSDIALPAALLVFSLAFVVQWLVNDSVIGGSIIFWILFGLAVSINLHAEEENGTLVATEPYLNNRYRQN